MYPNMINSSVFVWIINDNTNNNEYPIQHYSQYYYHTYKEACDNASSELKEYIREYLMDSGELEEDDDFPELDFVWPASIENNYGHSMVQAYDFAASIRELKSWIS